MIRRLLQDLIRATLDKNLAGETEWRDDASLNPLLEYFQKNPGRGIYKWIHYFEIYHRHFGRFRGRAPVVLEIGVFNGGSLQMWHHYFGPGAKVIGIDVDPKCLQFQDEATTILIGDQADRAFLASVREKVPHIDILIDDGGHTMAQQIVTFEELYRHVQPNGVYLCEDLHTSYWPEYGGGHRKPGTFVEYAKALIDQLHAWHSKDQAALKVDEFTLSTHGVHFYDSIVVFDRRPMRKPEVYMTGQIQD